MIDNKYLIVKKLGTGGSSDVYLACDEHEKQYAIKIIKKQQENTDIAFMSPLQKEFFIMDMLSRHPNILHCSDHISYGEIDYDGRKFSASYNILEYAENGSLATYIHRTGPFDEAVARFFTRQLVSAVAFMHDTKVAHMDVKPQNILFDGSFNLKLADFG
mmetsp:Transcript_4994/g.5887  ORF Transcript_4994/g.5887 Transcript_4994/m.5887 type:complete len:160 (+) Transcript_4994:16-495(+)